MSSPPAKDTPVPSGDTPPDVPTSTARPLVMSRGAPLLSVPSSVAQVSAVTVAMTPRNRKNHVPGEITLSGTMALNTAMTAPRPPLASTCPMSRRWPFSNFSATAAFSRSLKWESRLELMKNTASKTPHTQPPSPKMSVPTTSAPAAPDCDREPRR